MWSAWATLLDSSNKQESELAATEVVRARVDGRLKEEATVILAAMGLTVSDFVRIGLTRVVIEQGLPFEMRVPNRLTVETLVKSERGEDIHRAEDAKTLFKDLGI